MTATAAQMANTSNNSLSTGHAKISPPPYGVVWCASHKSQHTSAQENPHQWYIGAIRSGRRVAEHAVLGPRYWMVEVNPIPPPTQPPHPHTPTTRFTSQKSLFTKRLTSWPHHRTTRPLYDVPSTHGFMGP